MPGNPPGRPGDVGAKPPEQRAASTSVETRRVRPDAVALASSGSDAGGGAGADQVRRGRRSDTGGPRDTDGLQRPTVLESLDPKLEHEIRTGLFFLPASTRDHLMIGRELTFDKQSSATIHILGYDAQRNLLMSANPVSALREFTRCVREREKQGEHFTNDQLQLLGSLRREARNYLIGSSDSSRRETVLPVLSELSVQDRKTFLTFSEGIQLSLIRQEAEQFYRAAPLLETVATLSQFSESHMFILSSMPDRDRVLRDTSLLQQLGQLSYEDITLVRGLHFSALSSLFSSSTLDGKLDGLASLSSMERRALYVELNENEQTRVLSGDPAAFAENIAKIMREH